MKEKNEGLKECAQALEVSVHSRRCSEKEKKKERMRQLF
jgi:hypothetical protein